MKPFEKQIQEAFSEFQVTPPERCWERIQSTLNSQQAITPTPIPQTHSPTFWQKRKYLLIAGTLLLLLTFPFLISLWNSQHPNTSFTIQQNHTHSTPRPLMSHLVPPDIHPAPIPSTYPSTTTHIKNTANPQKEKRNLNPLSSPLTSQHPTTQELKISPIPTLPISRSSSPLAPSQKNQNPFPLPDVVISMPTPPASHLARNHPAPTAQNKPLITIYKRKKKITRIAFHFKNKDIFLATRN